MLIDMDEQRPPASVELSGAELRRWYWLKSELIELARRLGVATGGGKADLSERVAAALDGRPLPDGTPPVRRPSATALSGPISGSTTIPEGQRCTQQLREFFAGAIGPAFRFDQHMRSYIGAAPSQTLDDAVAHWYATRSAPPTEIGSQFELNRFLRDWHQRRPDGSREEALHAWRDHRSRPVDARERPATGR